MPEPLHRFDVFEKFTDKAPPLVGERTFSESSGILRGDKYETCGAVLYGLQVANYDFKSIQDPFWRGRYSLRDLGYEAY